MWTLATIPTDAFSLPQQIASGAAAVLGLVVIRRGPKGGGGRPGGGRCSRGHLRRTLLAAGDAHPAGGCARLLGPVRARGRKHRQGRPVGLADDSLHPSIPRNNLAITGHASRLSPPPTHAPRRQSSRRLRESPTSRISPRLTRAWSRCVFGECIGRICGSYVHHSGHRTHPPTLSLQKRYTIHTM